MRRAIDPDRIYAGSVPVGHAVRAFNAVAAPADRLSDAVIDELETTRAVPESWRFEGADPLHASRPVLLRKTSGPARLTVFKGGHEIVHEAALTWLEAQARGQRRDGTARRSSGGQLRVHGVARGAVNQVAGNSLTGKFGAVANSQQ